MNDRPVVVLGGDGGLGRAIVTHGRLNGRYMLPVVREDVDLAQAGTAGEFVTSLWRKKGPFAGLVHAAGIYPATRLLDRGDHQFDQVISINARSFLEAASAAARLARDERVPLSIVALSSGASSHPRPGTGIYAASKAALEAIVRGIALEGAPSGIRCNAVSPGYVSVGSRVNPIPASYEEALLAASPSGRLALPEDIAPVVNWILSDEARWINGQSIIVDGGASLGSTEAANWLS